MKSLYPASSAHAHCDGPCGIYDPASARIAAEAAQSMTKKMLALTKPDENNHNEYVSYLNTLSRYAAIKEEQADLAKKELLILWTDYFKPPHVEKYPNLHEIFWNAAKLCSSVKVEVNEQHAAELMTTIEKIHDIFWQTKNRDVSWYITT